MESWALVSKTTGNTLHQTTRYNYPAQEMAPEDHIWSFYTSFVLPKTLRYTLPPETEYSYGTASGKAKLDSDGNIRFDVSGINPKEMLVVIEELKKTIGCVKLNPSLTLPNNIKGRWAKIMHIWNWFNQNN